MAGPASGLQTCLNEFGFRLKPDGILGVKSLTAWQKLTSFEREYVDLTLEKEYGMRSRTVVGERGYAIPDYVYLSKSVCDEMVTRACALRRSPTWRRSSRTFYDWKQLV